MTDDQVKFLIILIAIQKLRQLGNLNVVGVGGYQTYLKIFKGREMAQTVSKETQSTLRLHNMPYLTKIRDYSLNSTSCVVSFI